MAVSTTLEVCGLGALPVNSLKESELPRPCLGLEYRLGEVLHGALSKTLFCPEQAFVSLGHLKAVTCSQVQCKEKCLLIA